MTDWKARAEREAAATRRMHGMEAHEYTADGLSPYDRERIADILAGHGTWFHADLLRLCAHADQFNLERIRRGFPETVQAYLDWREGRSFADRTPL